MVVEVGIVQEAGRTLDLEPGCVGLDEKQRLLSVGDGRDDVNAGVALARDEPLLAVQNPVIAVANGGRLQARQV